MKDKKALATLAALFAQIIFGFSFMFTKTALQSASPLVVIADRHMIAFLGMTVVMLLSKTKIKITRNIWKLVLMSLFQPILYFVFESYGIQMTTSSFSSVMIALIPVVTMISGIFVLGEFPSPLQYVFTVMSVAGVALMAVQGRVDGTVTPLGILLLFGAVLSSVAYNITSRKISKEYTVFERTYAMAFVGFVVFLAVALIENIKNPFILLSGFTSVSYLGSLLYLGIVSSVIAFLLLNFANTHLPVAKTTVFSNITTVVSVFAGAVFLKENFTLVSLFAAVMIVLGVWGVQILNVNNRQKK